MTIISHRFRFAFIAVPRTGSHSVRFALRDQLGPEDEEQVATFLQRRIPYSPFDRVRHGHQLAREVRDGIGAQRWSEYLSFAVVRNPWDRFISYTAGRFRGTFQRDPRAAIRRVLDDAGEQVFPHFAPQAEFVTDFEGRIMVDRICRYERLQSDFDELFDTLGLERRNLERRNSSDRGRYALYYDDELIERVGYLYRPDVDLFGYSFAGPGEG